MPSAESRYRAGVHYLDAYVRGLDPALGTSKPVTQRHVELLRLFQTWSDLLGDAHANLYRTEIDGHRIAVASLGAPSGCCQQPRPVPVLR